MMKTIVNSVSFLLVCIACSCNKKELPVPVHNAGSVLAATVNMDATYKWQVFYDLKSNRVVGQCLKTSWDIGLQPGWDGYHIVLNSSKSMFAMKIAKSDFALVSYADTVGFGENKKWDSPGGSFDSTAIGDWRTDANVFIIDRGFDELGHQLGMEKLQVTTVNDSIYLLRVAVISEGEGKVITVNKDSSYNLSFVSFDNGGKQVIVEPQKQLWDLQFTQYTHIFYDPLTPYLVTGCLLNRNGTTAYIDTSVSFGQISYNNVHAERLFGAINAIGYDWKAFNGTKYTTNTALTYIIKDADGLLYKLHFVDFYNNSGVKGNPKWEYQQL